MARQVFSAAAAMQRLHPAKLHTVLLWLALAATLAGCARAAPQPPQPGAQPQASAPTAQASATSGPPATATTMPTPALPTATPVPLQRARPGRLESSEGGLGLSFPTNWKLEDKSAELGTLAYLINPNQTAYVVVYQSLRPSDRELEAAAQAVHSQVNNWFAEVQPISDEETTLDDGTAAWRSEFSAESDGISLYVLMVSAVQGTRLVTLLAYLPAIYYGYEFKTIEEIARSMRLSTPRVAGVSRDEAIVGVGGESDNPRSYDPAYGGAHAGVFSGLVVFTPELGLAPDLAAGWEIDASGTVYTFHLRPEARFHDGRSLTAEDVIYSWERALAAETDSPVAMSYLGDILGARVFHASQAQHIDGLRALDEHTLQVKLDAPRPYFLQKLTAPAALVVDRANVESGPDWYRFPNGSGPYRLSRWEPGKYMLRERFADFYLGAPATRYLVTLLNGAGNFALYEFDYVDIIGLSSIDKARAADLADPIAGQLFEQPTLCTEYLSFDSSRPPFDDPQVRRAFSLATDRARYREISAGADALLAQGLYPPALPGFNTNLRGQEHDPEAARKLLAASAYGGPEGLPALQLSTGGVGGEIEAGVGALVRMWQEHLGVSVTVEQAEPGQPAGQSGSAEQGAMALRTWCADYPDPENFADLLFHSQSGLNTGHYRDPALDALLEQARTEPDPAARLGLYQQAERLILDGNPAIFLTHPLDRVYVKPRVQGYIQTPLRLPVERYLSIEPETP